MPGGFYLGVIVQCFKPIDVFVKKKNMYMKVPCGKCMGCRIARRREWMVRILHELSDNEYKGVFLTLTYSDDFLPDNGCLQKRELTLFWKRLRKAFPGRKIRYYACGEYGSERETFRPHYHSILFNLDMEELETYTINRKVVSRLIERLWSYGFNQVGTVTKDSASYVAGYIEKKLTGDLADEIYWSKGKIPPFSVMSQGIGKRFCDKNADQIIENLDITIKGSHVGIPRYYRKRLEIPSEVLYEKGEESRKVIAKKNIELYNEGGSNAQDDYLRARARQRYNDLKSRLSLKPRSELG